ncbi:hypothetical protein [Mycetocola sp. 2940]|uniref:hypothetical protein n=1 Tax=Mycetocola sp. 2940 TaxID=3156452 RepID=UPI0033996E23
MTDLSAETARNVPLVTDELIEHRVQAIVGRACARQVWMLFLDEGSVQMPLILPMANFPESPAAGNATRFAASVREIVDAIDAASVIFVWERYAGDLLTQADCAWAEQLHRACAAAGVVVRAQLLSHKRGVRWIAPEDYLVA